MVEEHGTDLNDKGAEWGEGGTRGPGVAMAGRKRRGALDETTGILNGRCPFEKEVENKTTTQYRSIFVLFLFSVQEVLIIV